MRLMLWCFDLSFYCPEPFGTLIRLGSLLGAGMPLERALELA